MKKYIFIWILPVILSACSNWLDVKPNDRISEDATFSSPRGFELALNGVYVDLNKSSLYGQALTWDFVEILAQRYAIAKSSTYNKEAQEYHYESTEVKGRVQGIWAEAYALIGNINLILDNCDKRREVLSDEYYELIKGEALALRALIHFDLFRLWGPVYSLASETDLTIPYYTHFSLTAQPKLTATDFMEQVITDLEDAAKLLENDPIKGGQEPLKPNPANTFKGYRALRLNYYAVKLLLGRAYLYVDNKTDAFNAVKEVIDVHERLFPWVDPASVGGGTENPDRMFSTELLFALQNSKRQTIYTGHFDSDNLKLGTLLIPSRSVIEDYVFSGELEDLRYKLWLDKSAEIEGGSYKELMKYRMTSTDSLYSQLIPMIKISEAFYIAAECEAETDQDAGLAWLNKVRNARQLQSEDWSYYYDWILETEYMREFYGEGQLFFFYKRKNFELIQSAYEAEVYVTMTPENYVLHIPEDESKYN